MKNHSIKNFDTNNSKVCTSISFVKAVFQNTIVKLCLLPFSDYLTAIGTRIRPHLDYFHPQWGFAICNKQRQKFVNDCLRLFASAISKNFSYFFDPRIFPTCVTIQYTGNKRVPTLKVLYHHLLETTTVFG